MKAALPIELDDDAALDVANIAEGAFAPLTGFLTRRDYRSVVDEMRLVTGAPWTMPITLDVGEDAARELRKRGQALLKDRSGRELALLDVEDCFRVPSERDVRLIYGTDHASHPGVAKELRRSPLRVGGRVSALESAEAVQDPFHLNVGEVRRHIAKQGWKTVAGFQTRNAPHRAHEYLQRVALELCDGLFIQPLVGWKKPDDFSPTAVITAYRKLVSSFYPANRVLLGTLRTAMRYAGPREAVFHALIRKNFGCTHFIIGRDHAGVGGFYGKYEAQELATKLPDLGITILALKGPYYCLKCGQIVTEKTCRHGDKHSMDVSGTKMRQLISEGRYPPPEFMREEISRVLVGLYRRNEAFCGQKKA